MKKTFIALTFIAVSIIGNAQKLSIVVKPATVVTSETNSNVDMQMSAMGQEMEIKSSSQVFQTSTVKKAENGGAELELTVTKKLLSLTAPGQDVSYDSEKDKSGEIADEFGKNVGVAETWTIGNDGKRTNETKEKNEEGGGMKSMMSAMLGGGKAVSIFDENIINREIKVGETWTTLNNNENGQMKNKTENTYTVKSVENNVAILDIVSKVTINGTMEQMGTEMELTGTNSTVGIVKVDITSGIILESEKTTTSTMAMSVQGMEMPMTGKITSKYKATIK